MMYTAFFLMFIVCINYPKIYKITYKWESGYPQNSSFFLDKIRPVLIVLYFIY